MKEIKVGDGNWSTVTGTTSQVTLTSNATTVSENPYQGYIDTVIEEVIAKTGNDIHRQTIPGISHRKAATHNSASSLCRAKSM